jgi:hypothetical protein
VIRMHWPSMFAGGAKFVLAAFVLAVVLLLIRARRRGWRQPGNERPSAQPSNPGRDRPGVSAAAVVETGQYRQFNEKFQASLQLKDHAALGSALRVRQEATELVRNVPALYCLGKHHEMILEYNHIGLGVAARQSTLESLTHEDEFKDISLILYPTFRSNSYQESLLYMTGFCNSYEEALYFSARLKEQFPNEPSRRRYEEIRDLQSKYGRWYEAHRTISHIFYSRATEEMDKGQYAAGLAVLDVILANAHNVGYNLDYEEYIDILDDMCTLAIRLLMQKGERRPRNWSASKEADELGCVLKRSMMYLTAFHPDCLPKDRELFNRHYKVLASVPWIDEMQEWRELTSAMK